MSARSRFNFYLEFGNAFFSRGAPGEKYPEERQRKLESHIASILGPRTGPHVIIGVGLLCAKVLHSFLKGNELALIVSPHLILSLCH